MKRNHKNILLLIFISILLGIMYSCANKLQSTRDFSINGLGYNQDSIYYDQDQDGIPDYIDTDPYVEMGEPVMSVPDQFVDGVMVELPVEASNLIKREYVTHLENKNRTIIDKDTTTIPKIGQGIIAYSIPEEMSVGNKYPIKLRISKEQNKTKLIIGERSISINDENVKSKITIESIRVEPVMSAYLLSSDSTFQISSLNSETQNIEDLGYTEWGWIVKPLKSGNNYLKLIIKVKIKLEDEIYYKDITVFDKNIKVKSNIKYGISNWLSKYWQWLMTTIFIPLVIFFYKKRKKDEE